MVEKILNNTTPYGKIRASHEGLLHSSTLTQSQFPHGGRKARFREPTVRTRINDTS